MAEYINREAVMRLIECLSKTADGETIDQVDIHLLSDCIKMIPTAEVEEVRWISVKDRLPEPETEVLVLAERKVYSIGTKSETTHYIVTTGIYEDGGKNTEDSEWCWYDHDFEYDEEQDAYIIPESWWEYKHYNGDDEHNHPIDDVVTHWMPLPQPPKMEVEE